ncbi:MAG: glycosyltransferase family 4 protein [Firmicutes bacterium]|jgi:glycosyltransferase involved in cell wall biosynthesis|uniref:Glycosyl transferase family 1 domain-containing protein n=1 Tax=Sulfobacillus benefaciens TaxID=453960 RepID=A0A2T2X7C3_9FIRM|nr:glycosyltransferase family 4 protein [Bacillota bacterium]PSR30367.1 MAG: hypothetical protein C7B43_06540 [Sulfobacillus benefaciens]HBQ94353.1 hypothetical protein [Sulfobacillus sp.]
MRLLWVLSSLEGKVGTIVAQMASSVLLEHGWEIDILPLNPLNPQVVSYPFPPGVEILSRPQMSHFGVKIGTKGLFRRLYTYYDRIVVDQNLDFSLKAIMAIGKHATDSHTILICGQVASELLASHGDQAPRLKKLMLDWYPGASRIIALSNRIYDDLVANFGVSPRQITRLFLPVPLYVQQVQPPQDPPLPSPRAEVVVFGELDPLKGLEGFLLMAKALYDQGILFRIAVLGDGPSRRDAQKLARSLNINCVFAGWPLNPFEWFRSAEVLVAPQYLDGCALDAQLAMFSGIPVLGYRAASALGELMSEYGIGELVDTNGPLALSDRLAQWLNHSRDKMGYRPLPETIKERLFGSAGHDAWMKALTG